MVWDVIKIVAVTILFVRHQIQGVARIICKRGIFLRNDFLRVIVAAKQIVDQYNVVKTIIKRWLLLM